MAIRAFRRHPDLRGQMCVELAVCIPIAIVIALVAFNLVTFLGICARFDRVAAEAVRIHAASPGYDTYARKARTSAIQMTIQEAMRENGAGTEKLKIKVQLMEQGAPSAAASGLNPGQTGMDLVSGLEGYRCTMEYRPLYFAQSVFGSPFGMLSHSAEGAVASFKPGVFW